MGPKAAEKLRKRQLRDALAVDIPPTTVAEIKQARAKLRDEADPRQREDRDFPPAI
eukprot:gene2199-4180_t